MITPGSTRKKPKPVRYAVRLPDGTFVHSYVAYVSPGLVHFGAMSYSTTRENAAVMEHHIALAVAKANHGVIVTA